MFRVLFFVGLISLVFGDGMWQTYVDDQLIGQGLDRGAIIGHDGSVWAISRGFSLKAGEGAALASLFKDPSDAFTNGITLDGIKYLAIKADDLSVYGKKGNTGITTAKTEQAIIIGGYGASKQPGKSALIVEKFGDYLRENGY